MIDTHIHIIPEVDDGAASMEESMAMLAIAKEEGVEKIIATPHYKDGLSLNVDVLEQYELIRVEAEKMGIVISLGNELYLCEEGVEALRDEYVYTMANSSYVLVELPFHHYYPFHEALLHQIQLRGFKIILAHIERYQAFRKHPEKLEALIKKGIYGQMNSRYVSERKTKKQAFKWIEAGYVHIVASDGHNPESRPNSLKAAFEIVEEKYGSETALKLFNDNPAHVLEDELLEDVKVEVKKGFFRRK